MRVLFACSVLILAPCLIASPKPSSPLTVVLEYDHPQSAVSFSAMQGKLQSTLHHAGIQVELRNKTTLPVNAEFESLVVFRMKGNCTMSAWQSSPYDGGRSRTLALAYTAEGEVLPFGEVECDTVRQSLQRVLGTSAKSRKDETLYGSALAVVMAHEIYHMMANEKVHTHEGLTKAKLSARELLDNELPLSQVARQAIEQNLVKHKETALEPKGE